MNGFVIQTIGMQIALFARKRAARPTEITVCKPISGRKATSMAMPAPRAMACGVSSVCNTFCASNLRILNQYLDKAHDPLATRKGESRMLNDNHAHRCYSQPAMPCSEFNTIGATPGSPGPGEYIDK